MVKIGSVRWHGKCSRHSMYDPETDGLGGIRGGCKRCEMLLEIWTDHTNSCGWDEQATPTDDAARSCPVSVYQERREELENLETEMGIARGRLAMALDVLTDSLILVGQHGVYCQSARQPGKPAMDIQAILKGITDAKELVSDVMQELRRK